MRSSNKGTPKQEWKPIACEMYDFLRSRNPPMGYQYYQDRDSVAALQMTVT